jgi:hypothetical protein
MQLGANNSGTYFLLGRTNASFPYAGLFNAVSLEFSRVSLTKRVLGNFFY